MTDKKREKHDVSIGFRGPQKLLDRIDYHAERLGIDRSAFIKLALNIWLDRFEEQGGRMMPELFQSNLQVSTGKSADRIDTDVGKSARRTG